MQPSPFEPHATRKILAYCAYQDRCRAEIEEKLAELEQPEDTWAGWLAYLAAERFWDEARFVKSFVRGKFFHKQWGPKRIRLELRQRGISDPLISQVIAEEISEEELTATLTRLIDKKQREYGPGSRDKLIRFLLQKGYRFEEFGEMV